MGEVNWPKQITDDLESVLSSDDKAWVKYLGTQWLMFPRRFFNNAVQIFDTEQEAIDAAIIVDSAPELKTLGYEDLRQKLAEVKAGRISTWERP
jgi:hypothetical protein